VKSSVYWEVGMEIYRIKDPPGRDVQRREDQPSDFTLVASGGKEFKVHRSVLSEASVFFQKLLSSDMMESKQGVVRLDMLTET